MRLRLSVPGGCVALDTGGLYETETLNEGLYETETLNTR